MLYTQGNLNLGPYSDTYDLIVPKDNQFRQFKELCNDFEFIFDELKCKYCPDNGRTAIDPRILFKYLLIKVIDNWSDVDSEYLQKLGKELRKSLYRFDENVKKDLPEKYEGEDLEKAMSYAESLVRAVSEMPLSQLPGVSVKDALPTGK